MKALLWILGTVVVSISLYLFFIDDSPRRHGTDTARNTSEEEAAQESTAAEGMDDEAERRLAVAGTTEETVPQREKRVKAPEEAFSDSETGRQVVTVLRLMRNLDMPATDKGKEAWKNITALRQSPKETFNEIRNGLPQLSGEHETKRQFLVQFASTLDVESAEKLSFLERELKDSVAVSRGSSNMQEALTPATIFDTYYKVSRNAEASEKLLTEVLPEAPPEVQKTLLSAFNKMNPKRTDELIRQYGLQGL